MFMRVCVPEVESRTKCSRLRPKTQKQNPWPKTDFSRTDPLEVKYRNDCGQDRGHSFF